MDNKDERIVDFNDLKNKAREKDVNKFEDYIYGLYYSLAQGEITMAELSLRIQEYMDKNNISYEKLFNIQKEMMKRYGFDIEDMESQMKNLGINLPVDNIADKYESMRKTLGFQEKYKDKVTNKVVIGYFIKNSLNNVEILLENENVLLKSEGKIDLQDAELNEFLCSYKKVVEGKELSISLCENTKNYQY